MSELAPTSSAQVPTVPPMPLRRVIGAYLSDARFESLRLLRTPAFSIPILAMPILFYTFFGIVLNGRAAASGTAGSWYGVPSVQPAIVLASAPERTIRNTGEWRHKAA